MGKMDLEKLEQVYTPLYVRNIGRQAYICFSYKEDIWVHFWETSAL